MLNELWDLHRAMTDAGAAMVEDESGFIQIPSTGPALRVYLGKDGSIEDLRIFKDGVTSYFTCGAGEAQRFPIPNFPALWNLTETELQTLKDWRRAKSKAIKGNKRLPPLPEFLRKLARTPSKRIRKLAWNESELRSLNSTLHRVALEVCDPAAEPSAPKALKALVERAQRIGAPEDFLANLGRKVLSKVKTGAHEWATFDEPLPALLFLAGVSDRKVPVQFEPAGFASAPAFDKKVREWINAKRQKQRCALTQPSPDSTLDAFGATVNHKEIKDKFPQVETRTMLQKISLMAKTPETPALKRHGLIGPQSFPVGSSNRSLLEGVLKTILQKDWENKTWKQIVLGGSGKRKKWGVVIAYPTRFPKQPAYLAVTLVGSEKDRQTRDFAAYGEGVIRSLEGLIEEDKAGGRTTEVVVFVLTKPAAGYTAEVVLSERMTAAHFIQSAKTWQEGAINRPALLIRVRPEAAAKHDRNGQTEANEWVAPYVPFPNEVFECLNERWIGMGERHQDVKRYGMADSLRLFLSDGGALDQRFLAEMLSQAVRSSESLILGAGQAFARSKHIDDFSKTAADAERHLRLWPSILGILLRKLNHQKRDYMENTAFLVGQLLSRVDSLHHLYCEDVRKGQAPPQLIGNAIMAVALRQPQKAMAFLGQRILPYQAWARTYSTRGEREEIKTQLRKIMNEIGEITIKLAARYGESNADRESARVLDAAQHFPKEANERAQAQMMLGYLSDPEKAQMLLGYLDASEATNPPSETKSQEEKTEKP